MDLVNSKLLLTHKKSLVNSKMAAITSYTELKTGLIVEGCVVSVKSTGLVVTFYNNVKVSASLKHFSIAVPVILGNQISC